MKAAILYKTDEYVDYNKINIKEQVEEILEDPNNFKLKEYTDEESKFNLIYNELGKPKVGITGVNIWENKDTLYAGFFIDYTEISFQEKENNKQKKVELNNFGSQITSQNVTGNLIIVKQKLNYIVDKNNIKTKTENVTINETDLKDVIEKLFIKEGIAIDVNGNRESYKYIVNPLEHLMLTDSNYDKHYVYHEYEVYTHVMMIITDTREINGKLNKTATLLAGKPVNGTVFVALYKKPEYNENPPYITITNKRLDIILSIRNKNSELTTGFQRSEREYVNFDKILELEKKKHSDKPLIIVEDIKGELLNIGITKD